MYVRCKRSNQTYFLYAEPTDTIDDLVAKISVISKTPKEDIRCLFQDQVLEPDKTLAHYKIENDNIVYFVFKQGTCACSLLRLRSPFVCNSVAGDGWEEVNVEVSKEEK